MQVQGLDPSLGSGDLADVFLNSPAGPHTSSNGFETLCTVILYICIAQASSLGRAGTTCKVAGPAAKN